MKLTFIQSKITKYTIGFFILLILIPVFLFHCLHIQDTGLVMIIQGVLLFGWLTA